MFRAQVASLLHACNPNILKECKYILLILHPLWLSVEAKICPDDVLTGLRNILMLSGHCEGKSEEGKFIAGDYLQANAKR